MISFVRCSVRTIRTSNELAIPSLASRAEASAASTLAVSATNRSAESSEESGSNSEWLQSREHLSVGRERPSESADSMTSVAQ